MKLNFLGKKEARAKLKPNTANGKFYPMKVYGDLAFSYLTNGATESLKELDKVSNQIGFNRVVSNKYICYYMQVFSFGATIDGNLLGEVRNTARSKYNRKIYIDIVTKQKQHTIKWKSTSMSNSLIVWRSSRKKKNKMKEEASEEGFTSDYVDENLSNQQRLEKSWDYLKSRTKNGTGIQLVSAIFRVRIPKEDAIYNKLLFQTFDEVFSDCGLSVKPVKMYLFDVLNESSPFKHESTKLASKLIANRVLTSEHTSILGPLTQGKLDKGVVVLGNDIKNKHRVELNLHPKSQDNTNILVVSSSGGGKSFLIKLLDEQIIALKDYLYITDYEGTEYTPFGEAYGATFLDLKSDDGKYYEPLRLTTQTGIIDLDKSILDNAINGTFELISVLLEKPLSAGQKNLLNTAITEYANGCGVNLDDKTTWENSRNMSVKFLLPKLENYAASDWYMSRYGKELTEIIDTMNVYFKGVYSYMFQNPISFDELKNEKIIITRFGADTTAGVTGRDRVDLRIKQLTTMLLNSELARYRRAMGDSFVVEFEELQRYLVHEGALDWVNTTWTGIRKCNGTAIGIINDPSKLNKDISALINNTNYLIVGKNEDLRGLEHIFANPKLKGCEDLVGSLLDMQNCFLLKYGKVCTIFRAEVPQVYVDSPIYQTRSDGN